VDAVIKIQNHKIHRWSYCCKFSKPVFSNCGPLKNRYISKIYGKGTHEHPETIHWHWTCFALKLCVLCLNLVLRGYSIPVDAIRGDRLIHPPDSLMGEYNITGHRLSVILYLPLRLSGGWISLSLGIPRWNMLFRYRASTLKLKLGIKHSMLMQTYAV